ncbi:MobH family relaxase [Buttiauxella selenatireducens]|uniref:MobH family relaxase n=1 Tax=Buttiauxella selenatireducens TaxID=3073902 RepID=A0ABY9S7P7_9ENTR|nr:MobH family relaxase [Buttiauxella sp. R73]WMY72456.1 MobH family relaxase [Buttiauxella sp. R73]
MNAGFYAKLKWLRKPAPPPESDNRQAEVENKPGWFYPQRAEALLATPLRQRLMKIIWQRTSMPSSLFNELYDVPIARFAELVQQLPASEYHHHAYPGGLLDHSLEVMAFAAKLRQRHLLPTGAAPEDQAREAEAWTAGVLYAALLHDLGKIVADIEMTTDDNEPWYPWTGPPEKPYRLKYRRPRDYQLHPVAGAFLVARVLPDAALNWLAQFPALYAAFLYCISGHSDRAGVMGVLVQEADRASVAQFMGARADSVLDNPQPSLAKQMLTALCELVLTRYKLNNPHSGSDGWLTEDALWLISKTTADNVRAWLLQQGVTGVPDNNLRLFDEMQAHGLIIPTPEGKAIWSCDIKADGGWTPGSPLTLLQLSPSRIWRDVENRPAAFAGQVTVVSVLGGATDKDDIDVAMQVSEVQPVPESDPLAELAFSLFAPAKAVNPVYEAECVTGAACLPPMADAMKTEVPAQSTTTEITSPTSEHSPRSAVGEDFFRWLREGLQARSIAVNDAKSPVHRVDGRTFLMSPGIFKLYVQSTSGKTGEEWRQVQRGFQKLGNHYRGDDGINIFTCEVKGPRKTRQVKGYLLDNHDELFSETVPEDNPYLSVMDSDNDISS